MFPDDALNTKVELRLGPTWTDITPHVYTRDPITITRGRQDEGGRADPATCSLTLNNKDGRYSPRNVLGPHYGLIGRNTPIRVSAGAGAPVLYLPGGGDGDASTPDHASLDITGDIDIRVDAAMPWRGTGGGLAGKYVQTGNQRSWIFWLNEDGTLTLFWSTDGGNLPAATSTAPVPVELGRVAVRATLDVNNGSGGRTVTFYTASSLAGSWTQLGDPVVQAGTTSIFNSTAPLVVGSVFDPLAGRYYGAEVRSGIGGSAVANPTFTAQAESTTSFADAAGRTWTLSGNALLTHRVYRFHGEVPAWPPRWGPSEQDGYVSIEAAGVTRRLGQGRKPIASALRRVLSAPVPFTAWWPLEEPSGARRGASGYAGKPPMLLSGDASFTGTPSGGVGGGLTIDTNGRASAGVTGCPTFWMIAFCLDVPADIAAETATPMIQWRTPGGNPITQFSLYTAGGFNGQMLLEAVDAAGNVVFSQAAGIDVRGLGPLLITVSWRIQGADPVVDMDINGSGLIFIRPGDTSGPITSVGLNMSTIVTETQYTGGVVSHLIVTGSDRQAEVQTFRPAAAGYVGEVAAERFQRLCDEETLTATVVGDPDSTEPMGPQLPAPILDLLGDCEDADGGTFYEARDEFALRYRPRAADCNTAPALTLDYHDQVAYPLEPVDDDQGTRNDVTVERVGGSSARVVIEDGPLSTKPPEEGGVGVYDEAVTLNLAADSQLLPIAGWRAHLGTVDAARYPLVRLKLHKHPDLIDAVAVMDLRARIHLTGLPAWEPPGTVDLLADGYTEVLEPRRWTIEHNTVPGSPWRTGVLDDPVLGRADTDGSVLQAAVDADDTALLVVSTDGAYWTTDPAEPPIDLTVGGEVVTVTAVADGVVDGFDRTASNGWGTSPDGQAWTVSGTAADYSVASSEGRITFSATGAARVAALSQQADVVDVEAAFKSPVAAFTGAAAFLYVIGSYDQAANDWYALVCILNTNGTIGIFFERKTAGTTTALNGITVVPNVTINATSTYRARLKIQGGLLQGRVWDAASAEPRNWHSSFYDSTHTDGGDMGVQVFVPGGVTNGLPLVFPFPEVRVHNPQKLTVTRSVNGIAKSHAAGSDIRLAQPAVIAL
ncbi:hypothetical protein OHR68_09980 [Spirillospora sp. NBC_00431]